MAPPLKPFLKWAGNKYRVLPHIRSVLPPEGEGRHTGYAEPFLGAGSVFLNLAAERSFDTIFLNDFNADLIGIFRLLHLPDTREALLERTRAHFTAPEANTEETYYRNRDRFNDIPSDSEDDALEKAALFLYLNRHCFNGLCRYNKSGGFNVPFGRYKKPHLPAEELEAAGQALAALARDAFMSTDFGAVFDRILADDSLPERTLVYCDPPYAPLDQKSNFTAYAGNGFGWPEQERLAARAQEAAAAGAWVILSNHSTPDVRDLYRRHGAAAMLEIEVRRSISASGKRRKKAPELLAIFTPDELKAEAEALVEAAKTAGLNP